MNPVPQEQRDRAHRFVDLWGAAHLHRYSEPLQDLLHAHIDRRFDSDATLTAESLLQEFVESAEDRIRAHFAPPKGALS